jgi:AcrR family transcriptional regulator
VPEVTDQRVLRGRRNREAIVDAVVELVEGGNLSPTADEIAAAAGVARRSVYHHFEDLDDLMQAVMEKHLSRYVDLLQPVPTTGTLEQRCAAFVGQRSALAERLLLVFRSARFVATSSNVMAEQLAATDEYLRDELRRTFAAELRRSPAWAVEALDAMTSLDGWVRLRVNQRLSPRRARNVLEGTLIDVLGR